MSNADRYSAEEARCAVEPRVRVQEGVVVQDRAAAAPEDERDRGGGENSTTG